MLLSLGEKIRNARKQKGMSQEDLANLIGKSKNVISNWERGDNKPDAQMIEIICGILEISPNYLLNWISDKEKTIQTIIAHYEGKEFSKEELDDINNFIEYVVSKRENKRSLSDV